MIKSMTGYGSAKGAVSGLDFTVEIKSVNNRYLDTSVRLPRSFIFVEESVKGTVGKYISRGKVDVFITVDTSKSDDVVVKVNEPLAAGYIEALRSMATSFGIGGNIGVMDIARFQDVLTVEKKEVDKDAISAALREVAEEALKEFDAMRTREGEKLYDDILKKIEEIERLVAYIEERSPQTVTEYRAKLEQRMSEVLDSSGIEESRILTEAAIFADRIAVDEETVRLRSHISQLCDMLAAGSPIGRKMDFLIQEFNREANTIGSKCSDSDIARYVVDLKSEIEKIREQIQNIE